MLFKENTALKYFSFFQLLHHLPLLISLFMSRTFVRTQRCNNRYRHAKAPWPQHPPLRLPSSFRLSEVWVSQSDRGHGSLRPGVQIHLHSSSLCDLLAEPPFPHPYSKRTASTRVENLCLASMCGAMGTRICFLPSLTTSSDYHLTVNFTKVSIGFKRWTGMESSYGNCWRCGEERNQCTLTTTSNQPTSTSSSVSSSAGWVK